jgi:hypothetical protein
MRNYELLHARSLASGVARSTIHTFGKLYPSRAVGKKRAIGWTQSLETDFMS